MDDGDAVLPWASRLFFGRQRGGASAVSIEEVEEVVRGVVTDGITATRMIEGVRGQAVAV